MKNATQILKENPIAIKDLFKSGLAKKVKHLIWLGQVEVINHLVVDEELKLELLEQIKIVY